MPLARTTAVTLLLVSTACVSLPTGAQPGRNQQQTRTLFTWSGTVDREVILVMQGRDLMVRGERDILASRSDGSRTNSALPRTGGDVRVRVHDGRGNVDVIQQPSARNDYTTRIRIRDPRSGTDRYRITAYWEADDHRDRGRDRNDPRRGGGDRGRDDRDRLESGVRWSGLIDDVVDLRIRGRQVDVVDRSGNRTRGIRSDFSGSGLPRRPATVHLVRADGRGNVAVIQQPSPSNNYTAIVRVRDPRSGAARYDLDLRW